MNAWDNLPNAKHIDAVLAHVKQHPDKWRTARDAARDAARGAALDAARDAARGAALDAARGAALDAARGAAWDAAWDACVALIAWDDAGDLLAMPVDAVRLLAACGHHPAVLLLPAVIALAKDRS
jgi:hypothetical protein